MFLFLHFQLSPSFLRRKSKLRVKTPNTLPVGGLSAPALGAIDESAAIGEGAPEAGQEDAQPQTTAEPNVVQVAPTEEFAEEVEDGDDSDIESVMTHDDALV